ncbi:MAG: hypothetical protein M1423_09815, partial [Acidobacteria bacterium]|nr:hypothetical protein [Acidobacteriota bacterium]
EVHRLLDDQRDVTGPLLPKVKNGYRLFIDDARRRFQGIEFEWLCRNTLSLLASSFPPVIF